jgi:hypothetical protein
MCRSTQNPSEEGTSEVNATRAVQPLVVTQGDTQAASLVGMHLLGNLADRLGLTSAYSTAVPWTGERAPGQDRGRLLAQVAVMLAGGGECVTDMAALRDQPELFGDVASSATIWRAVREIDETVLGELRVARAQARATAWASLEGLEEVVLDIDAALVEIHSENKEQAASHYKGGFGFHPMFCFADHSGEALAGILRPGNAAANSGVDQLAVVDAAIAQLPDEYRAGHHPGDGASLVRHRLVVRSDSAGAVALLIDGLVARNVEFSVYARAEGRIHQAIRAVGADSWARAVTDDGGVRQAGEVAELDVELPGWPAGTRAICRREKPHPGAQLRLWDADGYRHQVTLTNSAGDPLALELRQRRHARVENCIKDLRDTGLDRMPFGSFAMNQAWLELVLSAADLLAWLRRGCLDGELAKATPKTLRYRLLHVGARVLRRSRRVILRLPAHWPWAEELAAAYRRVAVIAT